MCEHTSTFEAPDAQAASMHALDADVSSDGRMSRRHFLTSSAAGVVTGAITTEALAGTAPAADRKGKSSGSGAIRGAASC